MQISVISGSPKGEKSVTFQYVRFLEQAFPDHTFTVVHAGRDIRAIEEREEVWRGLLATVEDCDGVLWATPVYVMLVPAQLKRFIELIDERNAAEAFSGKYAACLTTSIRFFDHTAHAYLHGVCDDLGMLYTGFCSAHMEDLRNEAFQEQFILFFSDFLEAIIERRPVQRVFPPLPAASACCALKTAPATFPTVAGHKIFRDEIWGGMRAIFKADDRYYRQHGLYDLPTRDYPKRIVTRATSLAMSIPAFRRDVVEKMPAYMVRPLEKAIETSTVLAKRRAK